MRIRCLIALLSIVVASSAVGEQVERWTQKDFLITFWCPPPATDENLANVSEEGFNLTWVPEEGLDVAARHGLRAMLQSPLLIPDALDDATKRAELDAVIARVKNHPALEAYYITDEPGAGAFPGLGKLVAYLRERDPGHLAYINLYPTYANEQQLGVSADQAERARVGQPTDSGDNVADNGVVLRYREHLRQYVETVKPDLISYDHYHFLKDEKSQPKDGKEYFLNLGMIRTAALDANRPFLNIIQADTIIKSWRLPNAAEMRWLVYTTMAYGGRGVSYFTYWGPQEYNGLYIDGKKMPLMDAVAELNHEMKRVGPALLTLNSVDVYHTAPVPDGAHPIPADAPVQVMGGGQYVVGLFARRERADAFMIVNRDYNQAAETDLKITLRGRRVEELDHATGEWVRVARLGKDRVLNVKLAPGDGRLFRIVR